MTFDPNALPGIPVLAILRGVNPDEVLPIAEGLIAAGIRRIEVPLNSPGAFTSIKQLITEFQSNALIGAGTVLTSTEVKKLGEIGCKIVVSPNFNEDVVTATKSAEMISCPGVFTPTEAFAALDAGADILKYFPADLNGPAAISAWRAVLPPKTRIVATGGTNTDTLPAWLSAGVNMIGVGNALFKSGDSPGDVANKAAGLAASYAQYEATHG